MNVSVCVCACVMTGTMPAGQTRTTAKRYQFVCIALWQW